MKYLHVKMYLFFSSKRSMANIALEGFRFRMFQLIMLGQIGAIGSACQALCQAYRNRFSDICIGVRFLYFDGTGIKQEIC